MVTSLLSGLALGAGAAMPLGPINILIMTNALRSYKSAVAIGLGAMSADIIYFIVTLFSGLKLLQYKTLANILVIFGSLFLIYIAWQIFKSRNNEIKTLPIKTTKLDIIKAYAKGLSLTLFNPYTIGFWLSVSTTIATKNLELQYTVAGIVISISLWITIMPFIVHKTTHLISNRVSYFFSIISSLIMLFFAISMLLDNFF